jgi:uncharacterized protein
MEDAGMKQATLIVFWWLVLEFTAQAASFDCAKAGTKVEHIICDNPDISKLDDELLALYEVALQDPSRADATRFSQKQWIHKWRNQDWCKDAACVREAYEVRIKHLREANSAASSAPEWSRERTKEADEGTGDFKGEYILIRASSFKGDCSICQRFKDNLNQFRKIDFDQCNPRISDKFPEFSRPPWKEIPFDMALAEKAIRSTRDYTNYGGKESPERAEYHRKEREMLWQQWLKGSAPFRAAGQAHMWITKIDMDGDGKEDTILRMTPGGRYPLDPQRPSRWSCDYNIGELYVIEAGSQKMAALFNLLANGSDIIRYAEDGHFYLVDWLLGDSRGHGWDRNDVPVPNVGGTRGVIISRLHQDFPSQPIGPHSICLTDWVPTGHFIPPPESQKGRIER